MIEAKMIAMELLEMPTLTSKYTTVYVEKDFNYNAPHFFEVVKTGSEHGECDKLAIIHFQEGPIKECGVNGVCNEDLLNMVLCRLQHFQESEFKCEENQRAIEAIESALAWLRIRTDKRAARGVEGTHVV